MRIHAFLRIKNKKVGKEMGKVLGYGISKQWELTKIEETKALVYDEKESYVGELTEEGYLRINEGGYKGEIIVENKIEEIGIENAEGDGVEIKLHSKYKVKVVWADGYISKLLVNGLNIQILLQGLVGREDNYKQIYTTIRDANAVLKGYKDYRMYNLNNSVGFRVGGVTAFKGYTKYGEIDMVRGKGDLLKGEVYYSLLDPKNVYKYIGEEESIVYDKGTNGGKFIKKAQQIFEECVESGIGGVYISKCIKQIDEKNLKMNTLIEVKNLSDSNKYFSGIKERYLTIVDEVNYELINETGSITIGEEWEEEQREKLESIDYYLNVLKYEEDFENEDILRVKNANILEDTADRNSGEIHLSIKKQKGVLKGSNIDYAIKEGEDTVKALIIKSAYNIDEIDSREKIEDGIWENSLTSSLYRKMKVIKNGIDVGEYCEENGINKVDYIVRVMAKLRAYVYTDSYRQSSIDGLIRCYDKDLTKIEQINIQINIM